MTTSVVGYEEVAIIGQFPDHDEYNKQPKFCSRCGRELKSINRASTYDIYTGKPINQDFLICRTLRDDHDIWKEEGYGAWVLQ